MTLLNKVKKLVANMQRAITDLTAIKTALIENGAEMPEETTTSDYAEKVSEVYNNGKNSAKNPLEYATRCTQIFYGAIFPENYELTLNLPTVTNLTMVFQNAINIVKLTIKGNASGARVSFSSAFRTATLVMLDLSEFIAIADSDARNIFNGATALKEVKGIFDFSNVTMLTDAFRNCNALENIAFKASSISVSVSFANSPNLTSEAIQSIIDGLATVETQQTLTLYSTIKANLTTEQMTQILTKNWVVM